MTDSHQNDGGEIEQEEGIDLDVPHWIERPEGLSFTAWLAINQARQLHSLFSESECDFWQWARKELGDNFARWRRKYSRYIEAE